MGSEGCFEGLDYIMQKTIGVNYFPKDINSLIDIMVNC